MSKILILLSSILLISTLTVCQDHKSFYHHFNEAIPFLELKDRNEVTVKLSGRMDNNSIEEYEYADIYFNHSIPKIDSITLKAPFYNVPFKVMLSYDSCSNICKEILIHGDKRYQLEYVIEYMHDCNYIQNISRSDSIVEMEYHYDEDNKLAVVYINNYLLATPLFWSFSFLDDFYNWYKQPLGYSIVEFTYTDGIIKKTTNSYSQDMILVNKKTSVMIYSKSGRIKEIETVENDRDVTITKFNYFRGNISSKFIYIGYTNNRVYLYEKVRYRYAYDSKIKLMVIEYIGNSRSESAIFKYRFHW